MIHQISSSTNNKSLKYEVSTNSQQANGSYAAFGWREHLNECWIIQEPYQQKLISQSPRKQLQNSLAFEYGLSTSRILFGLSRKSLKNGHQTTHLTHWLFKNIFTTTIQIPDSNILPATQSPLTNINLRFISVRLDSTILCLTNY